MDGRTHEYGTAAAVLIAMALEMHLSQQPSRVMAAAAGALSGVYLSPDLDIPGITRSERRALRIPILGYLFVLFWYPYSLIPHRSIFSHLPILGTGVKLLYLYVMGYLWCIILEGILNTPRGTLCRWWARLPEHPLTWAWVHGMVLSDTAHWVLDGMPIRT